MLFFLSVTLLVQTKILLKIHYTKRKSKMLWYKNGSSKHSALVKVKRKEGGRKGVGRVKRGEK